jgi:hypothetical protein
VQCKKGNVATAEDFLDWLLSVVRELFHVVVCRTSVERVVDLCVVRRCIGGRMNTSVQLRSTPVADVAAPVPLPPAAPTAPPAPAAPGLSRRTLAGLAGVLLASLIAGLNEHVTEVALPDIRGALSIGYDDGSWVTALYEATQVSAMMFAPWCSATFSLRRFTIGAIAGFALLGLLCPLAPNLTTLYVLRALQGLAGGCLPPMLMTVALRFLPPGIKLYGLGAYALTATFGPNLGTPLAALWTEYVGWRFAFWQIVPPAIVAIGAVAWGLPQDPLRLERFRQFDWRGVLLGFPAIASLVIGLHESSACCSAAVWYCSRCSSSTSGSSHSRSSGFSYWRAATSRTRSSRSAACCCCWSRWRRFRPAISPKCTSTGRCKRRRLRSSWRCLNSSRCRRWRRCAISAASIVAGCWRSAWR